MDEQLEQNLSSKMPKGFYEIGHNSKRLVKRMPCVDWCYKNIPENIILREWTKKSVGTQYQVIIETKTGRRQKVFRNGNEELEVKSYPKTKKTIEKPQTDVKGPSCLQGSWIEVDNGFYCVNKQKNQIYKKARNQDKNFSKRLPYANKKIKEIHCSMMKTKYEKIEEMIFKLQLWKLKQTQNSVKILVIFPTNWITLDKAERFTSMKLLPVKMLIAWLWLCKKLCYWRIFFKRDLKLKIGIQFIIIWIMLHFYNYQMEEKLRFNGNQFKLFVLNN